MRIRLSTQSVGQRIKTLEEALENDGSVTRPIGHFRGMRMDIWEARDEFTRIDASGAWPTCKGLRSLP